jgi:uncharacterized protein YrrD
MLRSVDNLGGFTILATDGEIGRVDEFYFDDENWAIRYLVINTGLWLLGRKVLISPIALGNVNRETRTFSVHLTKAQVENSPDIDTTKPVSRQHELDLLNHYDWAPYWTYVPGPHGIAVPAPSPESASQTTLEKEMEAIKEQQKDPHLRSTNEVIDYRVQASDGDIGHIGDLLVDEDSWTIEYILVASRNWLPGENVLVPTKRIQMISSNEKKIQVGLSQKAIKNRSEYDSMPIGSGEIEFHRYFD